jgi:hypothetical protein
MHARISRIDARASITASWKLPVPGKTTPTWPDRWAPAVSERDGEDGTGSGGSFIGPRAVSGLGQNGFPVGPFYFFPCFAIFLLCFLISLITFSFELKISSNQFLKFSNIQNINTTQ